MIWPLSGAALVAYQFSAVAFGWPRLSHLASRRPWSLLIWLWLAGLAVHFVEEGGKRT